MPDQVGKAELTPFQIETIADAAIEAFIGDGNGYEKINSLMMEMAKQLAYTEVIDNGGQNIWDPELIKPALVEKSKGVFVIDPEKQVQLNRTNIPALAYKMVNNYIFHAAIDILHRIEGEIDTLSIDLKERLGDYDSYAFNNDDAIIIQIQKRIFENYIDKEVYESLLKRNIQLITTINIAMFGFFKDFPEFPPKES